MIADCGNIRNRTDEEEAANAQLIAYAPEMIEILRETRKVIKRLKLSMLAHPDCETGSEFDYKTSMADRMELKILSLIEKATTI